MAQCSNCKKTMSCGCQKRTSSTGRSEWSSVGLVAKCTCEQVSQRGSGVQVAVYLCIHTIFERPENWETSSASFADGDVY